MVLAREQFGKTYFVLSSTIIFGGLLVGCDHHKQKKPDSEHERVALIKSQLPVVPPVIPSTGCPFGPGDLPQKTLSPDAIIGKNLPVDHFVFVVQENRSFDHYFQDFSAVPGTTVDVPIPMRQLVPITDTNLYDHSNYFTLVLMTQPMTTSPCSFHGGAAKWMVLP
jgi:hypothetical protein